MAGNRKIKNYPRDIDPLGLCARSVAFSTEIAARWAFVTILLQLKCQYCPATEKSGVPIFDKVTMECIHGMLTYLYRNFSMGSAFEEVTQSFAEVRSEFQGEERLFALSMTGK